MTNQNKTGTKKIYVQSEIDFNRIEFKEAFEEKYKELTNEGLLSNREKEAFENFSRGDITYKKFESEIHQAEENLRKFKDGVLKTTSRVYNPTMQLKLNDEPSAIYERADWVKFNPEHELPQFIVNDSKIIPEIVGNKDGRFMEKIKSWKAKHYLKQKLLSSINNDHATKIVAPALKEINQSTKISISFGEAEQLKSFAHGERGRLSVAELGGNNEIKRIHQSILSAKKFMAPESPKPAPADSSDGPKPAPVTNSKSLGFSM